MEDVHVSAAQAAIDAYEQACEIHSGKKAHNDVWLPIVSNFHGALRKLMAQGQAAELAGHLSMLGCRDAGHGYYLGKATFDRIVANRDFRTRDHLRHLECLVRFGEAVGCLNVLCRAPGQCDPRFAGGVEPVLEQIEQHIGIDLTPPSVLGGVCGIVTERGVLHMRHLNAAYAAWRMTSIFDRYEGEAKPVVCEIGAGAGFVPYYCSKYGVEDYTIIDLINLNIVQGYFLTLAVGQDRVRLFEKRKQPFIDHGKLRVLPEACFQQAPDRYFDCLLNQDSFPEIHPDIARAYLRQAKRNTRGCFLSINQESMAPQSDERCQTVFFRLADEVGGFSRSYRFPYWIRESYVEELWRLASSPNNV